ncbi:hypothetical protein ACWY4P_53585 (plasmid) [Streptomyces sp. LZ34]
MSHRPTQYLADHARSGRALFAHRDDAHTWTEEQTSFHHPDQTFRWVDGGEHGWQALKLADGTTAGTVYALQLDGRLPDYDADDWD